jgi:hypothetical protein
MQLHTSIGGLIPLWILGAPFVAGLIGLMTAPRTTTRPDSDSRSAYPRTDR